MPGTLHEVIVKLVQDQPEIAANLIGLADGEEHGLRCSGAETRSCSVGSPGPVERRADGVVKLTFEGGSSRIVIVDVGILLETIMETKSQPYHSAYSDRLRKEGREEGREEGGVLEARKLLLTLRDASPTPVEPELREQVEQCSDLGQFEAWATEFATTGRLTMLDR